MHCGLTYCYLYYIVSGRWGGCGIYKTLSRIGEKETKLHYASSVLGSCNTYILTFVDGPLYSQHPSSCFRLTGTVELHSTLSVYFRAKLPYIIMEKELQEETKNELDAASVEKSAGVIQSDDLKRAPRRWIIAAFLGYVAS